MYTRALLCPIFGVAFVLCVVAPSGSTALAAQKVAARKTLTVGQLEGMIRKGSPDNVVSQDLLGRGLAAPVDRPLIEKLKRIGAGPATLTALQHLLPKVRLVIQTVPGAAVTLNDIPADTVGDSGELVLAVEPGAYDLRVAKKDHTAVARTVNLALNQPQVVQAPLEWTVGFLTVDAGSPDAQIAIAGAGQYRKSVERLPLPVGPHEVKVTAPFKEAFSTVVLIEGGKTHEIPVKLEIDGGALKALGAEVLGAYSKADYPGAIRLGPKYFERGGTDPEILKVLALSHYQAERLDTFPEIAVRALAAGAELTFHTSHYHSPFTLRGSHAAELGVSATEVRFTPIGKCNLGALTVPLAQIHCAMRSSGDSATLILTVPNPKNPAKSTEVNLVEERPAKLEAIMRLIEMSRRPAP